MPKRELYAPVCKDMPHRNTVNRPATRPRCDICDREFETVEHFERHQRGKDHHRTLARHTS